MDVIIVRSVKYKEILNCGPQGADVYSITI